MSSEIGRIHVVDVESGAAVPPEGNILYARDTDKVYKSDGATLSELASGGSGVSDHGGLTGLSDDDHLQYHTDARGDARYATISHTHAQSDVTNLTTDLGLKATKESPTFTGTVTLPTGNSSNAPIKLVSGTVKSSPLAGEQEYDGICHYSTHADGERGVDTSVQHITLTTAYTTPGGTTALQKLFNAPTNGRVTVAGNTTYYFECAFGLTAMSSTSGTYSFGLLGTATYTRVAWWALANKGAATPVAALQTRSAVSTATAVVAANTSTTGQCTVRGKIVVGTGGTVIPAFATSVAAASVVSNDSYFRIWPAGSNTVQSVGNWS